MSDGTAITLAGEVGLLSRNIVVRGSPTEDSFGGRILVSRINQDGVDYVGKWTELHRVKRNTHYKVLQLKSLLNYKMFTKLQKN